MGSSDFSTDLGFSVLTPAPSVRSADANSSNRDAPSPHRPVRKIRAERRETDDDMGEEDSGETHDESLGELAKSADDEHPESPDRRELHDESSIARPEPGHELDDLA